jgi:hypothetical protein
MSFRVVNEKTGKPIGFGLSIVRQSAHAADASICYIVFSGMRGVRQSPTNLPV